METTKPNTVLPYTQMRPRQPKRFNVRLIIFVIVAAAPFVGAIAMYANYRGIRQNGNVAEVDLKALGNYPFDKDTGTLAEVPKEWRNLDGKKVALKGFMFPTQSAGALPEDFQFVYNIQKCCFSGPPQVQERVFGRPAPGHQIKYSSDFCRITGTLHVAVKKVEGVIVSIYTIDVDDAEPG